MVKNLMDSNRGHMQEVDRLTAAVEQKDIAEFHLSMENRELRDRIEILESVISTSNIQALGSTDLDAIDWRDCFEDELNQKAPSVKSNNETINRLIVELFENRKL